MGRETELMFLVKDPSLVLGKYEIKLILSFFKKECGGEMARTKEKMEICEVATKFSIVVLIFMICKLVKERERERESKWKEKQRGMLKV